MKGASLKIVAEVACGLLFKLFQRRCRHTKIVRQVSTSLRYRFNRAGYARARLSGISRCCWTVLSPGQTTLWTGCPVFVLTHHAPQDEEDPSCVQEGLIDEIVVHLAPVLLGDGVRIFDCLGLTDAIRLETTDVSQSGQLVNLQFRVVK